MEPQDRVSGSTGDVGVTSQSRRVHLAGYQEKAHPAVLTLPPTVDPSTQTRQGRGRSTTKDPGP